MPEQTTAEVVFDCVIRSLDRKLEGPTTSMVERILGEAGLDGVWALRHSRRIRKKGRGRFGVIRMEDRGGSKSLRIWCKPLGNDTGFEYSMHPPKGEDIDAAYRVLSRVHPVTLQIPESDRLPRAFFDRVVRVDPIGKKMEPIECVEVKEDAVEEMSVTEPSSAEEQVERPGGTPLLAVDPSWELWQDEAVDRALMAISFVAEDGYARKAEASASIIEHLDIKGFCGGASDSYTSVEGSMRSLTMALWKRKRYIERILGDSRNGRGASDSVRGYMITPKGEKRLESIKDGFGAAAAERMNPRWRRPAPGASQAQISDSVAVSSPWSLSDLKEMVAAHDRIEKQIGELDGLVSVVDSDLEAIRVELASLDEEARRIDEKKKGLHERALEKERERREWEEMKKPHEEERDRLERMMGTKR